MSILYEVVFDLILKSIVSPTLTLIFVPKPWIVGSPQPSTFQTFGFVPGRLFSQATLLVTGGVHTAACADCGRRTSAASVSRLGNSSRRTRAARVIVMT